MDCKVSDSDSKVYDLFGSCVTWPKFSYYKIQSSSEEQKFTSLVHVTFDVRLASFVQTMFAEEVGARITSNVQENSHFVGSFRVFNTNALEVK